MSQLVSFTKQKIWKWKIKWYWLDLCSHIPTLQLQIPSVLFNKQEKKNLTVQLWIMSISFIDQLDVPKFNCLCTFEKKVTSRLQKKLPHFYFWHIFLLTHPSLLDLLSIKTLCLKTFHLPKITLLGQPEQCVPEQHIVITTKTLSMTPKINLST